MRDEHTAERVDKISIRPGVSILSVLRHLNYKPWFALAEFVDNAMQSYLDARKDLEALHGKSFRLQVRIDIEATRPGRISIKDNAAGIAAKDFPRAFRPAAVPTDRTGLSEFGMGMKSAACWFAPRWHVRTKALGEGVERTVRFDVDRIVQNQLEEVGIADATAKPDQHYTEVVLEDLHHVPVRKTVAKIKEHLSDIYRVFMRDGQLEIRLGDEVLAYAEPGVLTTSYVRDKGGKARLWRKDINFDLGGRSFGQGLRRPQRSWELCAFRVRAISKGPLDSGQRR